MDGYLGCPGNPNCSCNSLSDAITGSDTLCEKLKKTDFSSGIDWKWLAIIGLGILIVLKK